MTASPGENMKSPLKSWVRALELTAPVDRRAAPVLPVLIGTLAERFGAAPALTSRATSLSYGELAASLNRYARWALERDLAPGDVVCLLMPNCPEYLAIWLGLTRVGVTVSLLNTNLSGEALAHSINIVSPRYIIVASALTAVLRTALPLISAPCWVHGDTDDASSVFVRIDLAAAQLSAAPLTDQERPPPALDDRALLIYTSGTTGLPKAANVSHLRIMQWSHWFAGLMNTQASDRMYNCLPLYHSVGGVVATGATLVGGGTVVLRERFSASEFWKDVVTERCTLFQYIGELCRYLLAGARQSWETQHSLRLCCGNGLRADVWEPFRERFRIPQILEYYAATEGSFSLYNCEGRPGAIGRIPPFLSHRMPVALVKFDLSSSAPVRDESGRCIRCATNEAGEAIGEISAAEGTHGGRFEGYADAAASEKKIIRDVFAPGDAWYRTGDLMRKDEQGFYYFVDRVGDTFRWKGENVSTGEVTAVVTAYPGVTDAAVYGVAVPGTDGRAGMAALVVAAEFDLTGFRQHLADRLPDYARPLFLRIVAAIEITGTFKLRKQELAIEGFDRTKVSDALYFDDRQQRAYTALDESLYRQLQNGKLRV
ncbi:MAG TPA: long-chain-acyl-CoA synthetase [Steroidobacteraceae bacterium]